mmetsp:Transcript_15271/g.38282  ORF Transcript_15271/g.38282 Transcript_15271/m.38282 type:complete len:323 (-) Transcript_15271:369-1337(-)
MPQQLDGEEREEHQHCSGAEHREAAEGVEACDRPEGAGDARDRAEREHDAHPHALRRVAEQLAHHREAQPAAEGEGDRHEDEAGEELEEPHARHAGGGVVGVRGHHEQPPHHRQRQARHEERAVADELCGRAVLVEVGGGEEGHDDRAAQVGDTGSHEEQVSLEVAPPEPALDERRGDRLLHGEAVEVREEDEDARPDGEGALALHLLTAHFLLLARLAADLLEAARRHRVHDHVQDGDEPALLCVCVEREVPQRDVGRLADEGGEGWPADEPEACERGQLARELCAQVRRRGNREVRLLDGLLPPRADPLHQPGDEHDERA